MLVADTSPPSSGLANHCTRRETDPMDASYQTYSGLVDMNPPTKELESEADYLKDTECDTFGG